MKAQRFLIALAIVLLLASVILHIINQIRSENGFRFDGGIMLPLICILCILASSLASKKRN